MWSSRGKARYLALLSAGALLAAAATTAACAALLGVDDLPLRDGSDAEAGSMTVLPSEGGPQPGDGGCVPRGSTFCETECPIPDFCEDFEHTEDVTYKHWSGFGELTNPVQIEGGTTQIVVDDAATRSNVLASIATRPTVARSFAGLVHAIFDAGAAAATPRGLRVRFSGTMSHLSFDPDGAPSARLAYLFAVGDLLANEGLTVVFKDKGETTLDVVVQRRPLLNDGDIVDLVKLAGVGKEDLANSRPNFEFEVAPRELLIARKHVCPEVDDSDGADPPPADGLWLWVDIYVEKCLPLRGAIASPAWLTRVGVIGGVFVSPFGESETRLDDVALTFLR